LINVGCDAMIADSEKATIMLLMGTLITFENALLYLDYTHTLLSYKDIRKNRIHIITNEKNNKDFFLIKDNEYDQDTERNPSLSYGL
jgi:hypothetical protein